MIIWSCLRGVPRLYGTGTEGSEDAKRRRDKETKRQIDKETKRRRGEKTPIVALYCLTYQLFVVSCVDDTVCG